MKAKTITLGAVLHKMDVYLDHKHMCEIGKSIPAAYNIVYPKKKLEKVDNVCQYPYRFGGIIENIVTTFLKNNPQANLNTPERKEKLLNEINDVG